VIVWLDGARAETGQISIFSHALHYGTAVLDGSRFYPTERGVAIFRLADHVDRLIEGAGELGMAVPFDREVIASASREVVGALGASEGYVRQMVFYGDGEMGLAAKNPVRVAVMAWAKPAPRPAPIRLRFAEWLREGALSHVKLTGGYAIAFAAQRRAQAAGFDDALFVTGSGEVTEATAANVFIVRNGELATPWRSAPLLAGITRATLLELAAEEGLRAREGRLTRDDLFGADEIFLCSSAGEIRPVGALEGASRQFTAWPMPITERLVALYRAAVRGALPAHRGWIDPVRREAD
jgi:branched-chain amino acid aminotransferase